MPEREWQIRTLILRALLLCTACSAAAGAAPQNFLYTGSDDLPSLSSLLRRPDIAGVQVVYSWKSLETAPGRYDFSQIEHDLGYLESLNRKLFIQLQDRFFDVR